MLCYRTLRWFFLVALCALAATALDGANREPGSAIPSDSDLISEITFVAFDTETTGVDAKKQRIIEIGAIKFRGGKIIEEKNWLLNPQCRIPSWSQRVHGITGEMVKDSPLFRDVYPEFEAFIEDAVLIAHNARFDIRFVQEEAKRARLAPPTNPVLDSWPLFRTWFPDAESYSLEPLSAHVGILGRGHHRAAADSDYVVRIFQKGVAARSGLTFGDVVRAAGGTLSF